MAEQTVRKTFKYKLCPTMEQERVLDRALMRCRHVYNAALGERREAWRLRGVSVTYSQQKADLPDIKAAMPAYAQVHSPVLQDVVLRVDRAFQAFFQRIREGHAPGYPRFHGRDRYTSLTYPQVGNGATLADGSQIANPRLFRVAALNLKRAQRRVSRRQKGSNRRRKAVHLLAQAHAKVRRARQDFHHKTALALVRAYDIIHHEALQTANMVTNHHLAKSMQDAGWSAFLGILSSTAVYAGKTVVAVPPAYTSQACSGCGVLVQKGLSVRWHTCPACGTSLPRDPNAARNILRLGLGNRAK